MANKARLISDMLKLRRFDGQFMRRDLVDTNPLTWLLEIDGSCWTSGCRPANFRCKRSSSG